MNELEICVVTKRHTSDFLGREGLSAGQCKQRVIVDVYGTSGRREYRMQKEEEADVERLSDDELSEDEESDPFELERVPGLQDITSGSPCSIVPGTHPIAIPSNQSPNSPVFSNMTPTTQGSFFFRGLPSPFGSLEAVSPISSGYGSAPRFFNSIGTQTPPTTPVFFETHIRLRPIPPRGNDFTADLTIEARRQRSRRRLFQQENGQGRSRFYSEGSGPDADNQPLPDVVSFRERANSAPSRPVTPQVQAGRALRRISDEFETHYFERNGRRGSFVGRMLNYWTQPQRPTHNEEREEEPDRPNTGRGGNGSSV